MRGELGDTIQGCAATMPHNAPDNNVGDNEIRTIFDQVVLAGVPESTSFIPTLVVSSRNLWQPLADEHLREISTESEVLSRRHRIWIGPETEESRVRGLLSPVTFDWLTGVERSGFAFELDNG